MIIESMMRITGNLITTGDVIVEGVIEGDVTGRNLTVCEGGAIGGAVHAEEATIVGSVGGPVVARNVTLASTAKAADISYGAVFVEPGAQLAGRLMPLARDADGAITGWTPIPAPGPTPAPALATDTERQESLPQLPAASSAQTEPPAPIEPEIQRRPEPVRSAPPVTRAWPRAKDARRPATPVRTSPRTLVPPHCLTDAGGSTAGARLAVIAAVFLVAALGGAGMAWLDVPEPAPGSELLAIGQLAAGAPVAETAAAGEFEGAMPAVIETAVADAAQADARAEARAFAPTWSPETAE